MGNINRGWAEHIIWSIYTAGNSEALRRMKLTMAVCIHNPSTWEAEAEELSSKSSSRAQ